MADLADKIASANKRRRPDPVDNGTLDEYNLPVNWDDPEYIAARIVWRNLNEYSNGRADLLYTRKNRTELWLGHEKLNQNQKTLYRLAAVSRRIDGFMVPQVYEHILRHVKHFDPTKILISDELYWDVTTGEIKPVVGDMPAITHD